MKQKNTECISMKKDKRMSNNFLSAFFVRIRKLHPIQLNLDEISCAQ